MKNNPILILGLFDTAIMTARCFKKNKLDIYGMDYQLEHLGFSSNLIKSIVCPDPKINENVWIEFLLKWAKDSTNKFTIIPTSDEFVLLCAKYKNELTPNFNFLVPEYNIVKNIIERDKQFISIEKLGIMVPYFKVGPVYDLFNEKNKFRFPIAIKPLNTTKWRKYYSNKGFLLYDDKNISSIITELNQKGVEYIIQNIIEGDNTNNFEVNSLYLPNKEIIQHSIKKIRQFPDKFGTATCIENVQNNEIESLAKMIIKELGLFGFSNIEFKYNAKDNRYYYIETNPRVWLQINFSMKLGFNFPKLYYSYLNNQNFNHEIKTNNIKSKWVDYIPDFYFWLKYRKIYKIGLFSFLKTWTSIVATNLFSINDPIPFLKDLKLLNKIKKIFSKLK